MQQGIENRCTCATFVPHKVKAYKIGRALCGAKGAPYSDFYQKPNWAAVSFSVSAERFRAASSLSETGVLMVLLTP